MYGKAYYNIIMYVFYLVLNKFGGFGEDSDPLPHFQNYANNS